MRARLVLDHAKKSEASVLNLTQIENSLVELGRGYESNVLQAKVQLASAEARPTRAEGALEIADARVGAVFGRTAPQVTFTHVAGPIQARLPAGKVLVVFGPNGSGKTTLIRLILGTMNPSRGAVRLDGIEMRQLSLDWRRNHIAYVPQEPAFFDGTLRENLTLDRSVTDDDLLVLVREMGLEHFLAHDPLGLDRPISSHDTGLAVGLRRRLALIRAVLAPARVVVMDEPTEGLDQAGQMIVAKLLSRLLAEGRTLIVASNEPFILRSADLLVDMSKKPVPLVGTTRAPGQESSARPAPPLVGAS